MDRIRIKPGEACIRQTEEKDVEVVLQIYGMARRTMLESGNPLQWPMDGDYPGLAELREDMRRGASYVIEYEGCVIGTFALVPGEEPSYARISDGHWLDEDAGAEKPEHEDGSACQKIKDGKGIRKLPGKSSSAAPVSYCTIHRLAGNPSYSGIAGCCFDWCKQQSASLRSDTHRDNRIMQHAFEAAGFVRCGIIFLENGSERTAYQWIRDDNE